MAQKSSYAIVVLAWLMALVLFFSGAGQAKADYIFTSFDVSGATFTAANAINASGQIVGTYATRGTTHGFLLSGGNFAVLEVPAPSSANGINNASQIVGGTDGLGFLYSGGRYTTFKPPIPPFGHAFASGVNDSGQIVGSYFNGQRWHGFLYDQAGHYSDIGFPGSNTNAANAINNVGQIVGATGPAGFLYKDGTYTRFYVPGSVETMPSGINDSGQIVGHWDLPNGIDHGFLLSDNVYSTLDVPGATMTDANGINNVGEIVGTYVDASGVQHGFLAALAPVPEPSTFLLLGIGMLGLIGWGWRR